MWIHLGQKGLDLAFQATHLPPMVEVKICGLKDPTHIRIAAEAGVDWVGFVLYKNSPRNVLGSGAERLAPVTELVRTAQDFGVRSVVLTVNPDAALFWDIFHEVRPQAIQLHGQENHANVQRMRQDCHAEVEVWKAVSIDTQTDLHDLNDWPADRLLLDAKPPHKSALPGGNGDAFDWYLLQDATLLQPWFLAGGLTPDNVGQALTVTGAPGVDVSSGVECAPGVKDEDLIAAFVDAAKSN